MTQVIVYGRPTKNVFYSTVLVRKILLTPRFIRGPRFLRDLALLDKYLVSRNASCVLMVSAVEFSRPFYSSCKPSHWSVLSMTTWKNSLGVGWVSYLRIWAAYPVNFSSQVIRCNWNDTGIWHCIRLGQLIRLGKSASLPAKLHNSSAEGRGWLSAIFRSNLMLWVEVYVKRDPTMVHFTRCYSVRRF